MASNGKRRYRLATLSVCIKTFSLTLDYYPVGDERSQQIQEMTLNGSGLEIIARVLHAVSTATVIKELKKLLVLANCSTVVVEPVPNQSMWRKSLGPDRGRDCGWEESEDVYVELRGKKTN